jgi:hypothetical protein
MALPSVEGMIGALTAAVDQLTLQCADASVGHYIPEMARLPGFEKLHTENVWVSYHLITAIGAARRISAGSREPGYYALLVSCEREARKHQRQAMEALGRMAAAAPAGLGPLLQRLSGLTFSTMGQIDRATGLTVALLGPERIAGLMEWAAQVVPTPSE